VLGFEGKRRGYVEQPGGIDDAIDATKAAGRLRHQGVGVGLPCDIADARRDTGTELARERLEGSCGDVCQREACAAGQEGLRHRPTKPTGGAGNDN
jgi:hypothetical protein